MTSPRYSAGLLPYLVDEEGTQVFLGHMGGPFWARKQAAVATRDFPDPVGVERMRLLPLRISRIASSCAG